MLDTRIVDAAARLSIAKLGGEGILHIDDLPALGSQRRAVFAFLMDGKWHRGTHILDIAGGTEGLRRMRELRKLPGGQAPKVVFCTTENDVAHIARAMHAGANEYIMKPFDKDIVMAKFQEVGLIPLGEETAA